MNMDSFQIGTPESEGDFVHYYDLRWRILRAPWGQPKGSEKDEHENNAYHVCAKFVSGEIIGVGRLHTISPGVAQIRYMAIDENYRNQGMGKRIYLYLEYKAKQSGIKTIIVDARENAVGFYQSMGFRITGIGHTLFNQIKHKVMEKELL
jgi:N-acetylglutamate synthase-like GNAT family acetyltransferase